MQTSQKVDLLVNTLETAGGIGLMHVSIVPPVEGPRNPTMFICLLDVSGSMGTSASIKAGAEAEGFSRLDLVKHSVKTIIHMLVPGDYLAIITFESSASVRLDLTEMTEAGKKAATDCVESLHDGGGTNVWRALKEAIDLTRDKPLCQALNTAFLLFTDGETEEPSGGTVPTMLAYLKGQEPPFTINTFGYGYSLNSKLLLEIALAGNGMYSYIPDATMVGTTFVNYLGNSLATVVKNAYLDLAIDKLTGITSLGYPMEKSTLVFGNIQYGQTRDCLFKFNVPADKSFTVTLRLRYPGSELVKTIQGFEAASAAPVYKQLCRAKYNDLLNSCLLSGTANMGSLDEIKAEILRWPTKDQEDMQALLHDIESPNESEGQVGKAMGNKDWWEKWGMHYIRSLVRAHQLQQCHNFKDPGVQVYGGKRFHELQDQTDKLFISLPPPKASLQSSGSYSGPANMQSYMDCNAGCFDGEGLVPLANGTSKRVKDLRKDDVILNSEGKQVRVVSLVAIRVGREIEVVSLAGVKMTPWHPVRISGKWQFPHDLKATEKCVLDYVYDLVLDSSHVVTINGLDLVTLGHGMKDDPVVEHPYFGTSRIIQDLQKLPGWLDGNICIERYHALRSSETGLVIGFH